MGRGDEASETAAQVPGPHGRIIAAVSASSGARPMHPAGVVMSRSPEASTQAVTCGLISSTVFFTDWKERSNIAFSSAFNSIWWIFSIPFSPMVTGTPM